MPCDQIQRSTVQSELKNVDFKLLKKALLAMGFTVNEKAGGYLTFYGVHKSTGKYHTGTYQNGKMSEQVTGQAQPLEVNAVKRSYAAQIVQAGFPGWKLEHTGSHQEVKS